MKKYIRILSAGLLAGALCLHTAIPALAAEAPTELQAAAAYVQERGIMVGDHNGEMRLNNPLSRTELATILARLHSEGTINPDLFTWACYFRDVPLWAKGYVGYCTAHLLVSGYGNEVYGADDPVIPAAACTVILRACGYGNAEHTAWTYATACNYAFELELIDQRMAQATAFTRGDMALLIYRAVQLQTDAMLEPPDVPQTNTEPSTRPSIQPSQSESAVVDAPDAIQSNTITSAAWSREDFSLQADPTVFTGPYTRELYNTIRQTLVDTGRQNDPSYRYAYTMVGDNDYSAVVNVLGRMEGIMRYEHHVPSGLTNYYEYLDYFAVSAEVPKNYEAALDFIQPAIAAVQRLRSDREKVTYLNDYLKTLLAYENGATAGITQTFTAHEGELKAACGSYARAMRFLCAASDIPCITISTRTHTWNLVYVDGEWLHVDVSTNDLPAGNIVLLAKNLPNRIDRAPEATAFLKELLVPGSNK